MAVISENMSILLAGTLPICTSSIAVTMGVLSFQVLISISNILHEPLSSVREYPHASFVCRKDLAGKKCPEEADLMEVKCSHDTGLTEGKCLENE